MQTNDPAERCRREIEAAESAVRDRCGFGEYLWLQDWREELALLSNDGSFKPISASAASKFASEPLPKL